MADNDQFGQDARPNVAFASEQPSGQPPDIGATPPIVPGQAPPLLPPQQPAAQAQPPRMGGMPLLVRYISQMIHPGMTPTTTDPNNPQPARPVTRGDATLQFMGEFLANMSQGFAAAGHGPGANLRGFAGAAEAPYQRQLAGYQLGQQQQVQQAQIAEQQARAQQAQAQAELMRTSIPIQTPSGQTIYVPSSQVGNIFRGLPAAQVSAAAKMNI